MHVCQSRASAFLLPCFIVTLLALVEWEPAWAWIDPLTPQERQGHRIYHRGGSGTGRDITARLADSSIALPASTIHCTNCHGSRGQGTDEGGLRVPSLTWSSLTSAHTSALTGTHRAPYDDSSLARAILEGRDASGHLLHTGMPRFQMSTEHLASLIAYVKQLGGESDMDAGVNPTSLALGTALPLTGPLSEIGQDVQTTLHAYMDHINQQGGIYGRKLDLVVEDSQGSPQGTVAATRRLIETHQVFALVGSFEPTGSATTNQLIAQEGIPALGPLSISPHVMTPPHTSIFYVLPGFEEQARALVNFLVSHTRELVAEQPLRIGLVFSASELDADALAGARAQAIQHNVQIVVEQRGESQQNATRTLVETLMAHRCNAVFYFGSKAELHILASEMDQKAYAPVMLSLLGMVDPLGLQLPRRISERMFFATSSRLPSTIDFGVLEPLVQTGKVRHVGFVSLAYTAASMLVEALKRSGRHITRSELIQSLEHFHEYQTGTAPPLTFSPTKRVGAHETFILGLSQDGTQPIPLSQQRMPRGQP